MKTLVVFALLALACCRKSEAPQETPAPTEGWRDDDKLEASLAKLEKLKQQDAQRPPPEAAPAPPAPAAQQPPAHRASVIGEPAPVKPSRPTERPAAPAAGEQVYCVYKYFTQAKAESENTTFIGAPMKMKHWYCTHGTVEAETERCTREARQRLHEENVDCFCTADKSFIGDICSQ